MDLTPEQANEREREFLARVQQQARLWTLMLGGGYANWSDEDLMVMPFWADETDAAECAEASSRHNS